MKWVIIILIVLAVVLAAALIASATKRKKDQASRVRADELRSDAAQTASGRHEEEARAREAEAEAERARAQADRLDAQAAQKRTSYDQTRARQEDAVRDADQVDPDVDHRSSDYTPDLDGSPSERTEVAEPTEQRAGGGTHTGPADPVPSGPETIVPGERDPRHDQI